jgi:hypothetical protein
MREHGTGGRDPLRRTDGHHLADGRAHDVDDLLARDCETDDSGELGVGLDNLRPVEHGDLLVARARGHHRK